MGDPLKFQNIVQYYMFNISFFAILFSELIIFITTYQKNSDSKKRDKGTKWVLIGCYAVCIYLSTIMVSIYVPGTIRGMVFPHWVSWIGIGMIIAGVTIRVIAVATLKSAFTVTVQTTDSQKLITTGIYHIVRNPAYTGSILSLLGVAVSFRSLIAIPCVLILCILCYCMRIHTEEIALQNQFGNEFMNYKKTSWRLVPYVW